MWLLSSDGTTAVLGFDVDVDASFSDIVDVLNIALFVNMELSKGRFFLVFDPNYVQLEADFAGPGPGPVGGKIDVDYESGSGLTRYKWDVAHSGPVIGFSWEFGG